MSPRISVSQCPLSKITVSRMMSPMLMAIIILIHQASLDPERLGLGFTVTLYAAGWLILFKMTFVATYPNRTPIVLFEATSTNITLNWILPFRATVIRPDCRFLIPCALTRKRNSLSDIAGKHSLNCASDRSTIARNPFSHGDHCF